MARQFATGDSVTVAAGGAAGASNNHTVVAVVQLVGTPGSNASLLQGLASSTRVWAVIFDSNKPFGLDDFGSGGATLTSNTWYVVAIGKASGSQHYQYHVAPLSTGVWTHTDSGFNVGDGSGGTTSIQFGVANTTGGNVALAAVAEYSGNLSNAAIEALGVTSMDTWLAASPRAAWQFNQASTSDSVTDLTGGGADQSAISGTTVVSDPAGWSYSTGETESAEGTADVGLALTVAGTGARDSAGTADVGLAFTVAATGDAPEVAAAEGTAAVELALAVAATGAASAAGTADVGLVFTAAAVGDAPTPGASEGTADLGLVLTVSAAGSRPSDGAAALGLVLDVAAVGAAVASGTADVGITLTLFATNTPAGEPLFRTVSKPAVTFRSKVESRVRMEVSSA